jgi:hypothetical protein
MGSASNPASGNPATGTIAVAAGAALLDVPGTVRTAVTIASTAGQVAAVASGVDCDPLISVKHLINDTKARVLRDTAAWLPHRTAEALCAARGKSAG